jgi:hypothetical protein
MKNFVFSLLVIAMTLGFGLARSEDKVKSPQQNKMAMCNKQAVGKTGDERKGFMKTCLSAKRDTQKNKS